VRTAVTYPIAENQATSTILLSVHRDCGRR